MRKNKGNRANIKGVYTVYLIEGLNLDRFIERVKKQGIEMIDVKKPTNKRLLVTVNFKDNGKFFAIAKEMCYNIKKIRDKGVAYPFFRLFRSFGLLVGGISFAVLSIVSNDFILAVEYSGSGSIYKKQVQSYLASEGVDLYSRFSQLDLNRLEDGVCACNQNLSFASLEKRGNKLKVELILSNNKAQTLKGNVYSLSADADGEIESVKVYRGTAVVKQGDLVKKGDLLVDGTAVIKEQTVKINVIACVSMICPAEYQYRSSSDGEEERAELYALAFMDEKDVVLVKTEKERCGEEYLYRVNMKYRRVLTVG